MSLMEIHSIPSLRSPIALVAFGGWSDAGEAATGVITHLLASLSGDNEPEIILPEIIAEIESEDFYDFQVNRPLIFVDDSMIRSLTWPGTQVFGVRNPC